MNLLRRFVSLPSSSTAVWHALPATRASRACRSALALTALLAPLAAHADLQTQKLNALFSATETKSDDGGAWTIAWSMLPIVVPPAPVRRP